MAALTAVVVAVAALPLAVASAGPVGDTGHTADQMSGPTGGKAGSDEGTTRGDGARDAATRDADARDGEARDGEAHGDGVREAGAPGGEGGAGGPAPAAADGGGPGTEDASAGPGAPGLFGLEDLESLELTTTARCGSELSSPDGIEAQTCVLRQDGETWARAYYRNATGKQLSSVLSLMSPDGRTVRMHCAVGAQDEPGVCETPRQRTDGELEAYTAVAEFAAVPGSGPESGTGKTGADPGPLLLRAGSNSPSSDAG
ncbi:hypothetical protein [Streptomyces poonensis]|uniref:Serine/threonine protein kinase n=1 Tax=Streptomyces poonensis TaxID=68255 RepID=A0A918UP66_9ACTN|nr:hypothetical protein [Streptomyces poonensis]GGZ24131.1 hypothetical protein GCM10010365_50450 [Streptomyces poonensis]GLJ89930.1 hypothetical protein GCM10017589_25310 [Streptomyces poonensis]